MYGRADVSLEQHTKFASMFGDVSIDTYYDYGVYIELKPKEMPKFTNIVYPLDGWTWMCLAITFVVTVLALQVINSYEKVSDHLVMSHLASYNIIFLSRTTVYLEF